MNNQETFNEKFEELFQSDLYELAEELDNNPTDNQIGLVEVSNDDKVEYDSYGSEDSTLERVYRHEELDLYIKLSGTRCSYQGTEWDKLEFVEPKIKEITVYE